MDKNRETRLCHYVKVAKEKGYRQETIEMGFMLSMSTDMIDKYGTKEKSLEEVIKLCEKHDNPQEFIGAIGVLIGID